jgi:hypothetical protein
MQFRAQLMKLKAMPRDRRTCQGCYQEGWPLGIYMFP